MALDFPASPSVGQSFSGPNNTSWKWDGTKWVAGAVSGGNSVSISAGSGITVSPSPITGIGSVSLSVPVGITSGGTGLVTYAQGDLLYGSAANVLSALPKNATASRYLSNSGTNNNPAWAQVNLPDGVTGLLPIANGSTGQTTWAQGDLLYASAANILSKLTKDANATRYLSNTGASNSPAWSQINLTNGVTGVLPVANGGTGAATGNAGPYLPLVAGGANPLSGDLTINKAGPSLVLQKTGAGQLAGIYSNNAGGIARWYIVMGDSVAESGGNAGSNFQINRCNDAGAYIDSPISISRASGDATFAKGVYAAMFSPGGNYNFVYSSPYCYIQWNAPNSCYMHYNQTTGDLSHYVNAARFFVARYSDKVFVNELGPVGGNGAYINYASFARLKSNIRAIPDPAERIKKLKPVVYTFDPLGEEQHGFVIEDLQTAYPETIKYHPETGQPEGYRPEMIIAGLAAALQDALRRIEALEEK